MTEIPRVRIYTQEKEKSSANRDLAENRSSVTRSRYFSIGRHPTWTELSKLEPRLDVLWQEARLWHRYRGDDFCANAVWYGWCGYGGIKERLCTLVGAEAHHFHGAIRSMEGYDVGYETVYAALPDCALECYCQSGIPMALIDVSSLQTARRQPCRDHWSRAQKYVAPLIFERDGYRCLRCGSPSDLTVDHIVPLSRGGKTSLANLQTLCRSCNSRKGAKFDG